MDFHVDTEPGGRERKRRETHRRITETGLRLFMERGYEATTLDAIAEASGIARRTLFHYFRSKDEIILAWQGTMPVALHDAILRQGRTASPFQTMRAALIELVGDMQPDVAVTIGRIVRSTDQLQASNHAKFLKMEQSAYGALRCLWTDTARGDGLLLVAMACIGILRLAINDWVNAGGERLLSQHIGDLFDSLINEIPSG